MVQTAGNAQVARFLDDLQQALADDGETAMLEGLDGIQKMVHCRHRLGNAMRGTDVKMTRLNNVMADVLIDEYVALESESKITEVPPIRVRKVASNEMHLAQIVDAFDEAATALSLELLWEDVQQDVTEHLIKSGFGELVVPIDASEYTPDAYRTPERVVVESLLDFTAGSPLEEPIYQWGTPNADLITFVDALDIDQETKEAYRNYMSGYQEPPPGPREKQSMERSLKTTLQRLGKLRFRGDKKINAQIKGFLEDARARQTMRRVAEGDLIDMVGVQWLDASQIGDYAGAGMLGILGIAVWLVLTQKRNRSRKTNHIIALLSVFLTLFQLDPNASLVWSVGTISAAAATLVVSLRYLLPSADDTSPPRYYLKSAVASAVATGLCFLPQPLLPTVGLTVVTSLLWCVSRGVLLADVAGRKNASWQRVLGDAISKASVEFGATVKGTRLPKSFKEIGSWFRQVLLLFSGFAFNLAAKIGSDEFYLLQQLLGAADLSLEGKIQGGTLSRVNLARVEVVTRFLFHSLLVRSMLLAANAYLGTDVQPFVRGTVVASGLVSFVYDLLVSPSGEPPTANVFLDQYTEATRAALTRNRTQNVFFAWNGGVPSAFMGTLFAAQFALLSDAQDALGSDAPFESRIVKDPSDSSKMQVAKTSELIRRLIHRYPHSWASVMQAVVESVRSLDTREADGRIDAKLLESRLLGMKKYRETFVSINSAVVENKEMSVLTGIPFGVVALTGAFVETAMGGKEFNQILVDEAAAGLIEYLQHLYRSRVKFDTGKGYIVPTRHAPLTNQFAGRPIVHVVRFSRDTALPGVDLRPGRGYDGIYDALATNVFADSDESLRFIFSRACCVLTHSAGKNASMSPAMVASMLPDAVFDNITGINIKDTNYASIRVLNAMEQGWCMAPVYLSVSRLALLTRAIEKDKVYNITKDRVANYIETEFKEKGDMALWTRLSLIMQRLFGTVTADVMKRADPYISDKERDDAEITFRKYRIRFATALLGCKMKTDVTGDASAVNLIADWFNDADWSDRLVPVEQLVDGIEKSNTGTGPKIHENLGWVHLPDHVPTAKPVSKNDDEVTGYYTAFKESFGGKRYVHICDLLVPMEWYIRHSQGFPGETGDTSILPYLVDAGQMEGRERASVAMAVNEIKKFLKKPSPVSS